jgi:hypothetical protein
MVIQCTFLAPHCWGLFRCRKGWFQGLNISSCGRFLNNIWDILVNREALFQTEWTLSVLSDTFRVPEMRAHLVSPQRRFYTRIIDDWTAGNLHIKQAIQYTLLLEIMFIKFKCKLIVVFLLLWTLALVNLWLTISLRKNWCSPIRLCCDWFLHLHSITGIEPGPPAWQAASLDAQPSTTPFFQTDLTLSVFSDTFLVP